MNSLQRTQKPSPHQKGAFDWVRLCCCSPLHEKPFPKRVSADKIRTGAIRSLSLSAHWWPVRHCGKRDDIGYNPGELLLSRRILSQRYWPVALIRGCVTSKVCLQLSLHPPSIVAVPTLR